MFLIQKPDEATVTRFLESLATSKLSYESPGLSSLSPAGFNIDGHRVKIGSGESLYESAKAAVDTWLMFPPGWVDVRPVGASSEVGTNVAVLARHLGFWSLNGCRVVLRLDNAEGLRHGFAYGTLQEHAECGEEAFLVELDPADDSVWYSIRAVSKPRAALARVGSPVARRLQSRFRKESADALVRQLSGAG